MRVAAAAATPFGMPKKPRDQTPHVLHHIATRGNDRHRVVLDELDRTRMLITLATTVRRYRWRCRAYTVLDNHYHFLIEPTEGNLATGMAFLNGHYARAFNRRHDRSDHVFGKPYYNEIVEDDAHLHSLGVYIARNAPKAGLCERAEDWPWSSFAATVGLAKKPSFLEPAPLLEQYGGGEARAAARYVADVAVAIALLRRERGET